MKKLNENGRGLIVRNFIKNIEKFKKEQKNQLIGSQ